MSRVGSPAVSTVLNPATGEVLGTVPDTTPARLDAAVQLALKAQQGWAALAPGERARLLRRFADQVEVHIPELAALEVSEAGHTVGNARWEAGNVRDLLEYAAAWGGAADRPPDPGGRMAWTSPSTSRSAWSG